MHKYETYGSDKGLISTESYKGQSDHPEYMSYLRSEHGEPTWVQTKEIMNTWTSSVIVSEGFGSCFPVIAFAPDGRCQMVHYSRDAWRPTNTDEYAKKLSEWQSIGCEVVLMRVKGSAVSKNDYDRLEGLFGSNFTLIEIEKDSRFGLVIDVPNRTALVQLSDAKELRKYGI